MRHNSLKADLGHVCTDILSITCAATYKALLCVSRKVFKRYLGIETPVYRHWHRNHAAAMQRELDREHRPSDFLTPETHRP